jgi:plasmid maintenance system antidote protein VapI|tara:strand:- start:191 stop:790 length:600 start_codon:yes stop_codon:yes gene_type:complete
MINEDVLGYGIICGMLAICSYVHYTNSSNFQLKCIVSSVDGNKYCVRERKNLQKAVDLIAIVTNQCKELVNHMGNKYPDQENVQRLVKGFSSTKIMETLPTSSYTAYSENKGEKLAFCLNVNKNENENLIDKDTLMYVAIHELAHIMSKSIGHKSEFWQNFKFLLENAKEAGIHNPVDYKSKPQQYCGMKITDNPYYDA